MEDQLKELETVHDSTLNNLKEGIKVAETTLGKLKNDVLTNEFEAQEDEIIFFKTIKPKVHGKLIYFIKRFQVETKCPVGSKKLQIKYFEKAIAHLQQYYHDHLEFYQYHCSEATHLDEHYFLRRPNNHCLYTQAPYCFFDHRFSTSHDSILATIMANDELINYLLIKIQILKEKTSMSRVGSALQNRSKLKWTGTKAQLVELGVSLAHSGDINDGDVHKKEIILFLGDILSVDLSDHENIASRLKNRENPTRYLDYLKICFEKWIRRNDD